MAKRLENAVLDGSLLVWASATRVVVCPFEPTQLSDFGLGLAEATVAPSDYSLANGDVSGRKATLGAQNGLLVATSGAPTHIGYGNGTTFLGATTCTGPSLTAGSTVNIPAHDYEQRDPT